MAQILAHRVAKSLFFIVIMYIVARSLGNPELYVSHDLAHKVAEIISGDINAESVSDAYFYLDVISVLMITTLIYLIAIRLFLKVRRK